MEHLQCSSDDLKAMKGRELSSGFIKRIRLAVIVGSNGKHLGETMETRHEIICIRMSGAQLKPFEEEKTMRLHAS